MGDGDSFGFCREIGSPLGCEVRSLLGHMCGKSCDLGHPLGHPGLLGSQKGSSVAILASVSPCFLPTPSPLLTNPNLFSGLQASPSSPGKWVSTWSASRRMATTWPTAPCPSWWSSRRSVMPAEPKSTAVAYQKAGLLRCLTSSWTRGMQVCGGGGSPGEKPRACRTGLFLLRLLRLFVLPTFFSF